MKRIIPTLAILSLMLATSVLSCDVCLWTRPEPEPHTCPVPELMPVRDIQIALRDMGYLDADEIDGIWCNQRMIDAWKAWERDNITESVAYWMKEMEIR